MNIDRWVVVVKKCGEWEPAHPGYLNRHDALNLGNTLWEENMRHETWSLDKWDEYNDRNLTED
jgi:hypothetical protein